MKRVKKLICCTLFMMSPLFSMNVWANDEAVAEAEKLLDNLGMEAILEQSITQSLDFQVQKNPELVPYVGVMKAFLAKHMSYESLKDDIVNLYSTTFSVQELKDISAFYSTETGKKTLQKLPELARISNQLGSDRVQENIEELHQMLEGASKLVEESKQL
jgi:hypothetical protein